MCLLDLQSSSGPTTNYQENTEVKMRRGKREFGLSGNLRD